MTIEELISLLGELDPEYYLRFTLDSPHSDRGDYRDVGYALTWMPSKVSDLIDAIAKPLGQTYEGYKGGDFTMSRWSEAKIGDSSYDCGEEITWFWLNAEVELALKLPQNRAAIYNGSDYVDMAIYLGLLDADDESGNLPAEYGVWSKHYQHKRNMLARDAFAKGFVRRNLGQIRAGERQEPFAVKS